MDRVPRESAASGITRIDGSGTARSRTDAVRAPLQVGDGAAGRATELAGRDREHGVRGPGGGDHPVVGQEILVDEHAKGPRVADRRDADDCVPRVGAHGVGVGSPHGLASQGRESPLVRLVRPRDQHQDGLLTGQEHERLHDLTDLDATRGGGLRGGPRALRELDHVALEAERPERRPDAVGGGQTHPSSSGRNRRPARVPATPIQRYRARSIRPRAKRTPSPSSRSRWLSAPLPSPRRLTVPRPFTTRCHGTAGGHTRIACPTARAARGTPTSAATCPYVTTRPAGTRRTRAYTRWRSAPIMRGPRCRPPGRRPARRARTEAPRACDRVRPVSRARHAGPRRPAARAGGRARDPPAGSWRSGERSRCWSVRSGAGRRHLATRARPRDRRSMWPRRAPGRADYTGGRVPPKGAVAVRGRGSRRARAVRRRSLRPGSG